MSREVSAPHHEHPDVVGSRNRFGLILILVADIAFFLSMLFVYFYLKQQNVNNMWLPAASEELPAVKPVSTMGPWQICMLMLIGFAFNRFAISGSRINSRERINIGTFAALLLSIVATVLQISQMNATGFTTRMGAYASSYYLFAFINLIHLLLTVFVALGNWNRGRQGLYTDNHWHLSISNVWWLWMVVSSGLGAFALSFT
jgi:heme/copper-type cytochrome/quinol oxidase subunit 3